ncbi:Oryzin [Arthrobotrys entomopaga]|nr:Oryzin [Arthrobotrys entomopaga]
MLSQGFISLLAIASLALAGPIHKITNAGRPGTIADKYIVVLRKDLSDAAVEAHTSRIASLHANTAKDLTGARSHGVEKKFKFSSTGFQGYSGGFDATTLQQILRSPEVDYVEQDAIMKINTEQTDATWGLHRISHKTLSTPYTYDYDEDAAGNGVTVYVIDTGIRVTHNEFQDSTDARSGSSSRASWGFNAVDSSNNDGNGHGTHCAGTIAGKTYGVSKKAKLVAVKVLNSSGSGSTSGVVSGMNWVAQHATANFSVASMSLGGGRSTTIDSAVDAIYNHGITIVVAAGNENQDASNDSPAGAPNAITVGAIDDTNTIASFSNWGPTVDVFAPGVSVLSSWGTGDSATKTISGTSMACPHIAGLAAYYISAQGSEGFAPSDVVDKITETANSGVKGNIHGAPNKIGYNGYA